ncbi:hypothetical protein COOONC_00952, partial [Cooperia oncophora]
LLFLGFCVLLGKELPSSRLKNVKWCSCGSCVSLTSVRENFCCREALEGEILLVNLRVERKKNTSSLAGEPEGACCTAPTALLKPGVTDIGVWKEGFGKRFELSACVRGAIIIASPSSFTGRGDYISVVGRDRRKCGVGRWLFVVIVA